MTKEFSYCNATCKNCDTNMHYDIRDYEATFICPECETEHTYNDLRKNGPNGKPVDCDGLPWFK